MAFSSRRCWIAGLCCAALLAGGCSSATDQTAPVVETSSSQNAVQEESAPVEGKGLALLPQGGWEPFPQETSTEGEPGTLQGVYQPKYATGFTIEYYVGGSKIVATDFQATANTAASAQRVLVLPQGATPPLEAAFDYQIDGALTRAVTLASSHAGHFGNLNAMDTVKGTSIKADACYIDPLKTALESGATQYVGAGEKADKELIAALSPQIIFVGGMQTDVEVAKKLEESGLFCLYFGDFAEEGYMGRAQWIELIGALLGREQEAQDFVRQQEDMVNQVIALADAREERPRVLWMTHSSQAPHWNVRTDKDYVNSMVSALGGVMHAPPDVTDTNSIRLSNEDFLPLMLDADKIIYGMSLNSYKDAADITYFNKEGQIDFAASKAFQTGDCYVVGYDWAQDTASAGAILQSLAMALYPGAFADTVDGAQIENPGKIISFASGAVHQE